MMKLGWGLINRREALWVKFLREKYKCGSDLLPNIAPNRRGSQVWKGIKEGWDQVLSGIGWKLGNGRKVKFWDDYWVPGLQPLKQYAIGPIDLGMRDEYVAEYISDSGNWRWNKIVRILPSMILDVLDRNPPTNVSREDRPIWRLTTDGEFSIKSAYNSLWPSRQRSQSTIWRRIWKLGVPQRVKHFLWLCMKGRLLTNVCRAARKLHGTEECIACGAPKEDTIHVLRECKVAADCWKLLVPPQLCSNFFSIPEVDRWIAWNIKQEAKIMDVSWSIWFPILCRHLWLNRNAGVFQGKAVGHHQVIARTRAVARWAGGPLPEVNIEAKRHAGWQAPYVGVVKWNVDGTSMRGGTQAACGGVARDHDGKVLGGYMCNLGPGDSFYAEAWAVMWALKRAWDYGWRKIVIENDCLELVETLASGLHANHPYSDLCIEIHSYLDRDWDASVEWCHRDTNQAADAVAKAALNVMEGAPFFVDPPEFLLPYVVRDMA